MDIKNIEKIISEEVKNFDFLNNEQSLKEQEIIDLLSNEDFQKQFICDSINKRNEKIKIIGFDIKSLSGNYDDSEYDDISRISLDYAPKIEYYYDKTKNPIKFDLQFYGDSISVGADGWYTSATYDQPAEGETWFDYIDWSEIDVNVYTEDGDEIKFTALENAPYEINETFIRHYTEDFITNESQMGYRGNDSKNNVNISQYCTGR